MSDLNFGIHSIKFLNRDSARWPGKRIRFTLTVNLGTDPIMEIEGCLARVSKDMELIWSPPQMRSGAYYANVIHMAPKWYDRIRDALAATKYSKKLAEGIAESRNLRPHDVDVELPEEIKDI